MIEDLITGWCATARGRNPCLRAVLVYEDFDIAVQSRSLGEVMARAAKGCEVQLSVWKFDFFQTFELAQAASLQAEQAELLIFAARRCDQLPAPVQEWLENWPLRHQSQGGALVAVFPAEAGGTAGSSPVGSLLLRAANRAHMTFCCESAQPAAAHWLSATAIGAFAPPQLAASH